MTVADPHRVSQPVPHRAIGKGQSSVLSGFRAATVRRCAARACCAAARITRGGGPRGRLLPLAPPCLGACAQSLTLHADSS